MGSRDSSYYISKLSSFQANELQTLLHTFGVNTNGALSELRKRAIYLINYKSAGFSYNFYLEMINQISKNHMHVNNANMMYNNQQIVYNESQSSSDSPMRNTFPNPAQLYERSPSPPI